MTLLVIKKTPREVEDYRSFTTILFVLFVDAVIVYVYQEDMFVCLVYLSDKSIIVVYSA